MSLAQIAECVKPVRMPLGVREQILDIVLAAEIERLERNALQTETSLAASAALPSDPKVREVLENGGFLFVRPEKSGEIWEYRRTSRDGGALTGKEAKHPPVYRLVVWGAMTLRCSCPARPAASAPCKHQDALAWSLGLPARKAVPS